MYRRKVQEGFVEMIDREMAGIDREMARIDREMAGIDREMAGIDREQGCSKNGMYKGGKLGKYRGNMTSRSPLWLSFVCNWIGATLAKWPGNKNGSRRYCSCFTLLLLVPTHDFEA